MPGKRRPRRSLAARRGMRLRVVVARPTARTGIIVGGGARARVRDTGTVRAREDLLMGSGGAGGSGLARAAGRGLATAMVRVAVALMVVAMVPEAAAVVMEAVREAALVAPPVATVDVHHEINDGCRSSLIMTAY